MRVSEKLRHDEEQDLSGERGGQPPEREADTEHEPEREGAHEDDREMVRGDLVRHDLQLVHDEVPARHDHDVVEGAVVPLERDEPLEALHALVLPVVVVVAADIQVELLVPGLAVVLQRREGGREEEERHDEGEEEDPHSGGRSGAAVTFPAGAPNRVTKK